MTLSTCSSRYWWIIRIIALSSNTNYKSSFTITWNITFLTELILQQNRSPKSCTWNGEQIMVAYTPFIETLSMTFAPMTWGSVALWLQSRIISYQTDYSSQVSLPFSKRQLHRDRTTIDFSFLTSKFKRFTRNYSPNRNKNLTQWLTKYPLINVCNQLSKAINHGTNFLDEVQTQMTTRLSIIFTLGMYILMKVSTKIAWEASVFLLWQFNSNIFGEGFCISTKLYTQILSFLKFRVIHMGCDTIWICDTLPPNK